MKGRLVRRRSSRVLVSNSDIGLGAVWPGAGHFTSLSLRFQLSRLRRRAAVRIIPGRYFAHSARHQAHLQFIQFCHHLKNPWVLLFPSLGLGSFQGKSSLLQSRGWGRTAPCPEQDGDRPAGVTRRGSIRIAVPASASTQNKGSLPEPIVYGKGEPRKCQ